MRNFLTKHAIRWNRLLFAGGLIIIFLVIMGKIPILGEPTEAFWLSVGVIIGAFANAMTAPDPSKSEVLELAERVIDKYGSK